MAGYLVLVDQSNLPSFGGFALDTGELVFGRSPECDYVLNHPTVSRRHAKVVVTEAAILVHDLGSRNGTYIDEARVRGGSPIVAGQRLRLGSVTLLLANGKPATDGPGSEPETRSSQPGAKASPDTVKLSPAQDRVFKQLLKGLSEKEIARRLRMSTHTVHHHVHAILRRFSVHSRPELLAMFLSK
jgi:pSer/pThr/pTyr-binding forkhead associated (FHA) protein